jgi:protein O-GlcNAc transferase
MNVTEKIFQDAIAALNNRNFPDAERLLMDFLRSEPNHIGALNLLTALLMSMGRFVEAEQFIARAVTLSKNSDVSFYNYGIILKQIGKPAQALEQFDYALQLNAKAFETWNSRGAVLNDLKHYERALADFDSALSLHQNYPDAFSNKGKSLYELKRYEEALAVYDKALLLKPDLAEAWLGRGNALIALKRFDEAAAAYHKASALRPEFAEAWLGYGNTLTVLARFDEAATAYDRALAFKPDLAEAWFGRANVFAARERFNEAATAYDRAIALAPDMAEAWFGRGNVLNPLKRRDEAFAAYDKALALNPDFAEAWFGRGNVLTALNRLDEAFVAYNKALSLKPDLAEAWLGCGNVLTAFKRFDEAFAAYDRGLALKPDFAEAWFGRGNIYIELNRLDDAVAAYERAVGLRPALEGAWLGSGNALAALNRFDAALAAYDRALALTPDLAEAWFGRGNVLTTLNRFDEAFAAYDKAFKLNPDLDAVEGARLHTKIRLGDWSDFATEYSHLISGLRTGKNSVLPFHLLALSDSPEDQLRCTKLWIAKVSSASDQPIWRGQIYKHDRINLAYVSADFHLHATSYLMAGMFERHDRSHFAVTAISIGSDDNSDMRLRLKDSFETFIDARALSDDEIARRIEAMEIDILVDLKGFSQGARPPIFSRRPAPVQVSYLGYPATMGADYIDYMIADHTLIPRSHQAYYAEKIIYLPDSYQVNDVARPISDEHIKRTDHGLPDNAFVFCCFNGAYKILPDVFDSWMRILRGVDGSVLWLLEDNASAVSNLRKEAAARGVSPDRMVFARRMSAPHHLARHRMADLFLDTLPCNAHTTASDALWAGLPVLTQIGATFAARVAASLLNAVRLPELIATSENEYERAAIELATGPGKLAAIRDRLAQNRLTTPLFDTQLSTTHIETAYRAIYARYQAGLPPDHIDVISI